MANLSQDERDKLSPVWDISQERVFTMTLLNQRIQFFLVFFTLVVGGALNARLQVHMNIILCIGALVAWLLTMPIFHTQRRVDAIMEMIGRDPTHPYVLVAARTSGHVRITLVMSYGITTLCCVLLTVGALLALGGVLTVAPK